MREHRPGAGSIHLSDQRPVSQSWFPDLAGRPVLCLAGGGGQQGPILAAAGHRGGDPVRREPRTATARGQFFHFSHPMEGHLGRLTETGFAITGFSEDRRPDWDGNPIRHFLPSYFIVRAERG